MPSCSGHGLSPRAGEPSQTLLFKRSPRRPEVFGEGSGEGGKGCYCRASLSPAGSGLAGAVLLQSRSDGFGVRHLLGQAAILVPQPGVGSRLQQQLHDVQKLAGGSWREKGKGELDPGPRWRR